ncbi:hypothetical protein AB4Z10_00090 [Bosea sp. RAF48]|uniref:hypothetical protein n=1 Tax=Bosea sp. RAF48 TaxID=3237480 RepID=UPI003F92205F
MLKHATLPTNVGFVLIPNSKAVFRYSLWTQSLQELRNHAQVSWFDNEPLPPPDMRENPFLGHLNEQIDHTVREGYDLRQIALSEIAERKSWQAELAVD